MKHILQNNNLLLQHILGDIDYLDIKFTKDFHNSNLLICFNPSLLNILYKYDQSNLNYNNN